MLSGRTLQNLRKRAGKSQADVAASVGITASVLSAYERGRRQPGIEIAGQIIAALGYRITFAPGLDSSIQARRLEDVLLLAEQLPFRPRPLATVRR